MTGRRSALCIQHAVFAGLLIHSLGGCFEDHKKDEGVSDDIGSKDSSAIGLTVDVPTGAKASPLYGAVPFTQPIVLFEEFGTKPLSSSDTGWTGSSLPPPQNSTTGPDSAALDAFLGQDGIYPYPTRRSRNPDDYSSGSSDDSIYNPWKSAIESFLGRSVQKPPAEGRPPGENWAHQRWDEFYPKVYFQTAQAGARVNGGLRDPMQSHGYAKGEFAPGGLYNCVAPGLCGTTRGLAPKFHPNFPIQNQNALWTFDGTFPPKLLKARYGEPVLMRHYNALPIDPAANYGFGTHTISTHEHNGHNPSESDGYTQSFFFPGQFYDYHWPMVLAGNDSINTNASDPKAAMPDGNGGNLPIKGDWHETMSTHWFHDHMLDFTAQNVYKGNAAMMNYYSALDRGNEAINDGVNLRFPSGTDLDWGNRDYDVNLVVADKAWDSDGQLFFNIFNTDGFLGDQLLANWLWKPYLDVRARRYRFRILNGAVSRIVKIAFVVQVQGTGGEMQGPPGSGVSYNRVPFHLIANDGNILEHAIPFTDASKSTTVTTAAKGILPQQGIAERFDVVIDFAQFAPGTKLYAVNLLEHADGRGPKREVPLKDVLSGAYKPTLDALGNNKTDPCVTQFMEFRVQSYSGVDQSMNPADYTPGKQKMIPLPKFTQQELLGAVHRTFEFARGGTDTKPWTIKTDGGSAFNMNPRRVSAAPVKGQIEIWHIRGSGAWTHPVHVHFEEGQIFKRGGVIPPDWERWGRKDVYRIGNDTDSTQSIDLVIRFREFLGSYMEHCHNTQHEDHAMLLRWDNRPNSQSSVTMMQTPMPSWDGVGYLSSNALSTAATGDKAAAADAVKKADFGVLGK